MIVMKRAAGHTIGCNRQAIRFRSLPCCNRCFHPQEKIGHISSFREGSRVIVRCHRVHC